MPFVGEKFNIKFVDQRNNKFKDIFYLNLVDLVDNTNDVLVMENLKTGAIEQGHCPKTIVKEVAKIMRYIFINQYQIVKVLSINIQHNKIF